MLRCAAVNSFAVARAAVRPAVFTKSVHSPESVYYERQESLKKQIVELRNELAPESYKPDEKIVAFFQQTRKAAANSPSLQR